MNLLEIIGGLFILTFLIYLFRSKDRSRFGYIRVTKFDGPLGPCPVTPGPRYICANCGRLIKTGHGHTREECEAYAMEPTNPDLRLLRAMKERPGRNDPKVRAPFYREPGTFKNWEAGR